MHRKVWRLALLALALGAGSRVEGQERAEGRKGWLGFAYTVQVEEVRTDSPVGTRVTIEEVHPGSPAERAGVRPGDRLVRWNGRADVVDAMESFRPQPGDTVRLRVRREGERDRDLMVVAGERPPVRLGRGERREGPGREKEVIVISPRGLERELRIHSDSLAAQIDRMHRRLQVMLRDSLGTHLRMLERELPEIHIRPRGGAPLFDVGRRAVAGAEFAEVNEGLAAYFGTDRGALVIRVAPGTPAARAGLEAGDVVLQAADQAVDDVAGLRRAVVRAQERDSRAVELEVLRKGKRRELTLRWE